MLPAKPIVIALLSFITVSIAWSVIEAWMPPDPADANATSFSARPPGHLALYELFEALGVPAVRGQMPPSELFQGDRRIVLLEPDLKRMETEKGALEWMETWIRGGGELVLAASDFEADWFELEEMIRMNRQWSRDEEEDKDDDEGDPVTVLMRHDLAKRLDLEGLRIADDERELYEEEEMWERFETFREMSRNYRRPEVSFAIASATGTLAAAAKDIETILLPEADDYGFEGEKIDEAIGAIYVETEESEDPMPIALEFALGQGSVTVVSEAFLFNNLVIGAESNGALAFRLARGAGDKPVILDEYYKGGMVSGSPFILFGVYPYGVALLSLLAALALWAWNRGSHLGPPISDAAPPRRNIEEYINAMAGLFRRGRKHSFVIDTCKRGMLDELRHELHLPHGTAEHIIMSKLDRHAPDRSALLRDALEHVQSALTAQKRPPVRELVIIQERLEACRTPKHP